MKKSAFTLIELLVVISIIAVLAGIALPVFSSAQEKSRVIKDANNLHQIGIGFAAYMNDSSDSLFVSGTNWPSVLSPKYVTDWKTFQSPFDKRASYSGGDASGAPASYDYNQALLSSGNKGLSTSDIASPSACIMIAPLMSDPTSLVFSLLTSTATGNLSKGSNPSGTTGGTHNHGRRINALFADSHVADMLMSDFHSLTPLNNPNPPPADLRWNK